MPKDIAICWFRQDLRLHDNPALSQAATHTSVLPIYILDDHNAKRQAMGAASRVWLHHSLAALNLSLNKRLMLFKGDAQSIIEEICDRLPISAVYTNRCYEPWRIARDKSIKLSLDNKGVTYQSFNGSLLWEPWQVLKKDGTPYKVFTPFYRRGCLTKTQSIRSPLAKPEHLKICSVKLHSLPLDSLELLPKVGWEKPVVAKWHAGESAAVDALETFIDSGLQDYKEGRNFPAKANTSRLSPYLHFGEISPNQIWHRMSFEGDNVNTDCFKSELGWREFSYSLLYYFPKLSTQPLQEKFKKFPWRHSSALLKRWQKGQTGYPIVDAAMRELWQTGYMHGRVRMVVGSFLVKNLLQHWRQGEQWFWDCLFDADLANNSASWQWIAGCGADAAPFFRVFNPITQGEKFDANGDYTRHFVPELKNLPVKYLFKPWAAPEAELEQAGIVLGRDYPFPMVDAKASRTQALDAYQTIRSNA